ncbi:PAS domain-containing protein [Azospirillum halopraeferens]|uniref:PAS domain-containing protein n=1 Tax=Azospirillum halopraeferens TaxID=34010 RepID=UPI0004283D5A|nr:PAS domain-containing protein [Azospirillum halopraeferens]
MSHAFAKDSRACAACVSWGGSRTLAADNTLVHVNRYSVEGECRTAVSQDYRKITRSYHTCPAWAPLPMLKSHGGRPERVPAAAPAAAVAAAIGVPVPPRSEAAADAEAPVCSSVPLDVDKAPPQARILYTYWRRLRQQRRMPAAVDIDTGHIRDCVSRLALLEATADGGDFVYRACGRGLLRRMGFRPVGRPVTACHAPEAADRWLVDLRACLAGAEPRCVLVRNDPLLPEGRYVELLLPLTDRHGRPGLVMAYRHLPGG